MKQAMSVEELVGELKAVLDADIEAMGQNIARLNELRGYVVKRDDKALGRLLDVIRVESAEHTSNEGRRNAIRRRLAGIFGVRWEEVTVSFLAKNVAQEQAAELAGRKERLETLVRELKAEYFSTAMLLNECARINSMLLNSILDGGGEGTFYKCDGSSRREQASAFMNIRL